MEQTTEAVVTSAEIVGVQPHTPNSSTTSLGIDHSSAESVQTRPPTPNDVATSSPLPNDVPHICDNFLKEWGEVVL